MNKIIVDNRMISAYGKILQGCAELSIFCDYQQSCDNCPLGRIEKDYCPVAKLAATLSTAPPIAWKLGSIVDELEEIGELHKEDVEDFLNKEKVIC